MFFDEISFIRNGFKNDSKLGINVNVQIGDHKEGDISFVSLTMIGNKEQEYAFTVKLTGFFEVQKNDNVSKEELLKSNAVAILMPYLRSQVSLLTAQPEVDCVVLPPFNISKLMSNMSND